MERRKRLPTYLNLRQLQIASGKLKERRRSRIVLKRQTLRPSESRNPLLECWRFCTSDERDQMLANEKHCFQAANRPAASPGTFSTHRYLAALLLLRGTKRAGEKRSYRRCQWNSEIPNPAAYRECSKSSYLSRRTSTDIKQPL